MANNEQRTNDDTQERIRRVGTFTNSLYNVWRNKAAEIGHKAVALPDEVWNKYLDKQDRMATLRNAKLYIESYMMGNIDPVELAQVMAEDDKLRYTISDLCHLRLEPPELDIQRNASFIDVGAGLKTFWSEMRVPLPSEVDAAYDIRNIEIGIEAGKKAVGAESTLGNSEDRPKRRTLREFAGDLRQRAASALVDKLSPYAEADKPEAIDRDEFFKTKEGQAWHDAYTYQGAKEMRDIANNVELQSQHTADDPINVDDYIMDDEAFEMLYWPKINSADDIKDEDRQKLGWTTDYDKLNQFITEFDDPSFEAKYKEMVEAAGTDVPFDKTLERRADESDATYQIRQECLDHYLNIRSAIDAQVDSEDKLPNINLVDAARLQQYKDIMEYKEAQKAIDMEQPAAAPEQDEVQEKKGEPEKDPYPLKGEYSIEELLYPSTPEVKEVMDNMVVHVYRDKQNQSKKQNDQQDNKQETSGKERPLREGYVRGMYDGKMLSFKGEWSGHTFTEDEVNKLLGKESITFDYTDSKGEDKTITGKLAWQKNSTTGRSFFGFEPDFKSVENKKTASDDFADAVATVPYDDAYYDEELDDGFDDDIMSQLSDEDLAWMHEGYDPGLEMQ